MGKEFAKLLIQLFAEEESEKTDSMDEEMETEFDDSEEVETSETVEETTEEPEKVKTFTQEELDTIVNNRLNRERKRLDRVYKDKLSKYEELAYLTQEGLKTTSLDDTLSKSREFYGKQGIRYVPAANTEEDEIIANYRAREIIEESEGIEDLQAAADRLLAKGVNISPREKLVLQSLVGEMESIKRISDLKSIGVKEEVYNSAEFKEFEKQFNKNTPISDVYNLYRAKTGSTKKVDNPGSMKSIPTKEKKEFISEAEYDKMTREEIRANMDIIEKSMSKW